MAGDHHGQRIVGAGGSDRANGAGMADRGGHGRIAFAVAVADGAQVLDDVAAEAFGEAQIDGDLKGGAAVGELLVDLPCHGV
jgi:hypothetical protein